MQGLKFQLTDKGRTARPLGFDTIKVVSQRVCTSLDLVEAGEVVGQFHQYELCCIADGVLTTIRSSDLETEVEQGLYVLDFKGETHDKNK